MNNIWCQHRISGLLMNMATNTERFTGRAEIYSRSRPSYPAGILKDLSSKTGMDKSWVVADIGSGTGKLAKLFVENGNRVKCVEPNHDMRSVLQETFNGKENVEITDGTAENSHLTEKSIDIAVCGQSFHWFRPDEAGIEFRRILRRGWVALIWNNRVDEDAFTASYERIVRKYSPAYHGTGSLSLYDSTIKQFFGEEYELITYQNDQSMDLDGITGRYRSASYSIGEDSPEFNNVMKEFRELFENYQKQGTVVMRQVSVMYLGCLSGKFS